MFSTALTRLRDWWRSLFTGADDYVGEVSREEIDDAVDRWWRGGN